MPTIPRDFVTIRTADGVDVVQLLPDDKHFKIRLRDHVNGEWHRVGLTFGPAGIVALLRYVARRDVSLAYETLTKNARGWARL